jgi:hypothetical protein
MQKTEFLKRNYRIRGNNSTRFRSVILKFKQYLLARRLSGGEQWRYGRRRAAVPGRLFVAVAKLDQ